jgi:Laminin B (Domain IV)
MFLRLVFSGARIGAMLAPAALALVLAVPASAIVAESSFTLDAEGWTGLNAPSGGGTGTPFDPVHVADGGDPGGFIQFQDQDQGMEETVGFFIAPGPFLGDASDNYGGMVSFHLRTNATANAPLAVLLSGGGRSVVRSFTLPQPNTWSTRSATITADGTWVDLSNQTPATLQDFAVVLPNLDRVAVVGDVQTAAGELTDLDTVSLTEGDGFPPTARTLTLRYKPKSRRFVGRLAAQGHPPCAVNELVRVFRKRAGPDRSVGMDRTSTTGQFLIGASASRGTYYAQAAAGTRGALTCAAARSPNLRLRKDGRPAGKAAATTVPRSLVEALRR